jgi:hypothetical protein
MRPCLAGREKHHVELAPQRVVPVVLGQILDREKMSKAGIVIKNVDLPRLRDAPLDPVSHGGFLRDIQRGCVETQSLLICKSPGFGVTRLGGGQVGAEHNRPGARKQQRVALTQHTTFTGSVGYLHAEDINFQAFGVDYAGLSPPYSPKLTINVGLSQSFPLASGANIGFDINTHYESQSWATLQHALYTNDPAYTKTDASLSYVPAAGW